MDSTPWTLISVSHPVRSKVPIPVFVALKPGQNRKKHIPVTGQAVVVRRKRRSAPKKRGGCQTCKIRHERCDQTKPACTKCSATGRKCDYINPTVLTPPESDSIVSTPGTSSQSSTRLSTTISHSTSLHPSTPLTNFTLSDQDGQFFQYFVRAASTSFFNTSSSPIWDLILQVAQSEPVIREVALANAILHNLHPYISANPADTAYIPVYKSALKHYANSVHSLKEKLASLEGEPDLATWEISILASFLFTAFELLLGNENGAYLQNCNGFNMLKSALQKYRLQGKQQIELPGNLKALALGMNRRDLQASTFGYGWTTQALLAPNVSDAFLSWADAVTALETVMSNILGVIRMHANEDMCRRWTSDIDDDVKAQIEDLKRELEKWSGVFGKWLRFKVMLNSKGVVDIDERIIHNTLMIQYWNAYIWIHTPFSKTQVVFDGYLEEFTKIVELAEEVLTLNPAKATTYSSEMEIIQPLFYVVQKCRDGLVRRRANGLLMRSGREGVWDGVCVGAAGSMIVEIEEEGGGEGVWVEERYRLRGLHLYVNRFEKKLMVKGKRIAEDGEEIWAGRTMCWGEQKEGEGKGEGVYGDEAWHWGFLFG